jgi:TonB-linked SusC/RagA family outer membrane protein
MKRNFTISGVFLLFILLINTAFAQNITVKGKITDVTTGEQLVGVSVVVKGTTTGTQTDANGEFSLNVSPNSTLQISYVGYLTQTIAASNSYYAIKLAAAANDLNQVVVIGYGTQRKIDNTGAVATVKGADLAKQPSTNPLSALQGQVAGVEIINSGQPGASPTINIRGLGTVNGGTNPLYVVDDVWYDDISFLSNNDIETLTVLKDASSTAIYGIRAANGVVIITTKHGKKGKPVITYNDYFGWQAVTNQVKMANGTEYATAINELYADNNITPAFSSNPSQYGIGTNWYNQILRNAPVSNNQIGISGGSEKYRYNVSFAYLNQDGIVKTNDYQKYTLHVTNDYMPLKNLKFGFSASILSSNSRDVNGSIFHQLYTAAPIVPVYYADGKYGDPADYNVGGGANYNPQATIDFFNQHSKNKELSGEVYGQYTIIKDLTFKSDFGGELAQAEVRAYSPIYYATGAQQNQTSSLGIDHTETRNWIWENTLTYNKTFGKNKLTALAGYSAQLNRTSYASAFADSVADVTKGNLHTSFPSGTEKILSPEGSQSLIAYIGEFARVNYSYDDRYLLNASVRHDGASEFYPEPYGYFYSVGAGWVITNEAFMKDQHVFNLLKLRGSFGSVGNAAVTHEVSVQTVTNDPSNYTAIFGNPQYTINGESINMVVPPSTKWEQAISTDFGIEGALLNNHLSFEAEYYNRLTQNAIFAVPIPASTGENGPSGGLVANQANIRNRGFEFSISWKQQVNNSVFYSISPNIGINSNVVTKVISGDNAVYGGGNGVTNGALATRTVVGEPIGEFYGYKVVGIFQTAAQVAASNEASTAKPGDFIYQDTNGDGQITSTDRVNLGNPNAKYGYGVNMFLKVKNFDFTVDLQGRADVSIYNANLAYRFGNENFTQNFYENRWHGPGTSNTYPSVNLGSTYDSAPNSFYVTSGAYFRVRNLQLGYTLPSYITRRLKIQSVRFFANAQNAINVFGYKGFSPEVGGGPTNEGIDANVYPLYATYNFGVNVTF